MSQVFESTDGFESRPEQQNQNNFRQNQNAGGLASKLAITASNAVNNANVPEFVKKFTETAATISNKPGGTKINVLAVENSHLKIAVLVLFAEFEENLVYVAHLLEETAFPLTPEKHLENNRTFELPRFTSEYWDPKGVCKSVVEAHLLASNPKYNGFKAHLASSVVIRKSVKPDHKAKIDAMFDHAVATITAVINVASGRPTSRLEVSDLTSSNDQLIAKFDFTPGATHISTYGDEIPGDVVITHLVQPNNLNKKDSPHDVDSGYTIGKMIVNIDFWRANGQSIQNNVGGFVPGYIPVFVITENSTLGSNQPIPDSLLSSLIALPSVIPLATSIDSGPRTYGTVFEPLLDGAKTSIGFLGAEYNPFPGRQALLQEIEIAPAGSEHMDSNGNKMTVNQILEYFVSKVNIVIAMDTLIGGPLDGIHSVIAGAVSGSKEEAIINGELDAFSNGLWSRLWGPKNQSILSLDSTYLYSGFYTDGATKKVKNIGSLTYLDAIKYSKGNTGMLINYASGFRPGANSPSAMALKADTISQLSAGVELTGKVQRVYFNNEFIVTLEELNIKLGIKYKYDGINLFNNIANHSVILGSQSQLRGGGSYSFNNGNSRGTNVNWAHTSNVGRGQF